MAVKVQMQVKEPGRIASFPLEIEITVEAAGWDVYAKAGILNYASKRKESRDVASQRRQLTRKCCVQ